MKRSLSLLAGAALAAAGVLVPVAAASAHHPVVSGVARCVEATGTWSIDWTVRSDDPKRGKEWKLNTATVNGPGSPQVDLQTGPFQPESQPFTGITSGLSAGTYELTVKASWKGGPNNETRSGSVTVAGTCEKPKPRDAAFTVATTPGACAVPGRLTYGARTHVASVTGTPDGATGPAEYSVTATAADGHLFANGQPTLTLSGSLEGPVVGEVCDVVVPVVAPVYTAGSCELDPVLVALPGVGYSWVESGPASARVLTAVPAAGYRLTGTTVHGPFDLTPTTTADACDEDVTPLEAAVLPQVCVDGDLLPGAIILPADPAGLTSRLFAGEDELVADDDLEGDRLFLLEPGTYRAEYSVADGYRLVGPALVELVVAADECELPPTTPPVTPPVVTPPATPPVVTPPAATPAVPVARAVPRAPVAEQLPRTGPIELAGAAALAGLLVLGGSGLVLLGGRRRRGAHQ